MKLSLNCAQFNLHDLMSRKVSAVNWSVFRELAMVFDAHKMTSRSVVQCFAT